MDKIQEAIEGIEAREQECIEADIERDKRISRNETTLRELCDQSKLNNIGIIAIPEEEEREKGIGSVFEEIIAKNFPNLEKEIVPQTMEAHRSPNTRDPRKKTPRHIVIKMGKNKDKDRLLKAAKDRNKITYKGKPIRLTSDL